MKLSLEALKERAGEVATAELLSEISGGTLFDCHIIMGPPIASR